MDIFLRSYDQQPLHQGVMGYALIQSEWRMTLMNSASRHEDCRYVYEMKFETSRLFISGATRASPHALILFGAKADEISIEKVCRRQNAWSINFWKKTSSWIDAPHLACSLFSCTISACWKWGVFATGVPHWNVIVWQNYLRSIYVKHHHFSLDSTLLSSS